ncbi:MAG: ArsR/SmtB family transcription factor [Roseburia sp.]
MLEKQVVKKEINYLKEAVLLFRRIMEKDSIEKLQKDLTKKYSELHTEVMQKKFEVIKTIEEEAKKKFANDQKELEFYFAKEYQQGECIGGMVLLLREEAKMYGLEEQRAYLENMSEEEYWKKFGERLTEYVGIMGESACEEKPPKEPMAIMRYILQMDLEDEEKWRLQQVFLEPEKHREIVFSIIERAITLLKSYRKEMDELLEIFEKSWSQVLAKGDFKQYLKDNIGIVLDENEYGLEIYPCFMQMNTINLFAKTDEDDEKIITPYIVYMGIIFDETFSIKVSLNGEKDDAYEEDVRKILKLLSDKSKFEILASIKEKRAYGSELAKQLDLTTATISHHMGALLSAGLIRMEKEDTKVYYSGKTEELREALNYCLDVLTKED